MHDARENVLKVGDIVVVPAKILSVAPGEYCTLNVETVGAMPGNGCKNQISALNTKQVYRLNPGDELGEITTVERDGKTYLS